MGKQGIDPQSADPGDSLSHSDEAGPRPVTRSLRFLPRYPGGSNRKRTLLRLAILAPVLVIGAAVLAVPLLVPATRPTPAPVFTQHAAADQTVAGPSTVEGPSLPATPDPTVDLSGWTPEPVASGGVVGGGGGNLSSGSDPGWWRGITWKVPALKAGQTGILEMYGIGSGWCAGWIVFPRSPYVDPSIDPVVGTNTVEPQDHVDPFLVTLPMPESFTGVADLQLKCYPVEHSLAGGHLFHMPLVTSAPDPWTFEIIPGPAVADQTLMVAFKIDDPEADQGKCSYKVTWPGGDLLSIPVLGGPELTWNTTARWTTDYKVGTIPPATPTGTGTWSSTCTDSWGISFSKTGSFNVQGAATPAPPTEAPTTAPTEAPTEAPPTATPTT